MKVLREELELRRKTEIHEIEEVFKLVLCTILQYFNNIFTRVLVDYYIYISEDNIHFDF